MADSAPSRRDELGKRIVVGVLSALGVVAISMGFVEALARPDRMWTMIFDVGAGGLGAYLVTRLPAWTRWWPPLRLGLMFAAAALPPPLIVSSLAGYQPGLAFLPFIIALTMTGSWWVLRGYRLDRDE